MNESKKIKKKGFSLLIASLSLDESDIMKKLNLPEELTFSLPVNSNFLLWQAFHNDVKQPGKNPAASMKYIEQRAAWLSDKYADVIKDTQKGLILKSASSDFVVRDMCLALLSGIDEDRVLELCQPVLGSIDYVVFIDRRLSSNSVKESQCILGKDNMEAIRAKMLSLSKRLGWKVISLQKKKFQEEDLNTIKTFCHLM